MKQLKDMTEPELKQLMNYFGQVIEDAGVKAGFDKTLFCLLLFNDPKVSQYVANCERDDMIKVLRETADRLERNQDVPR